MEGTVPRIIYQFRGKTRAYFPDIMIDDNHIVEAKSTWTLYRSVQQLHIAQAKARECLAQGLKFNLILVIGRTNGKQIAHLLPKRLMHVAIIWSCTTLFCAGAFVPYRLMLVAATFAFIPGKCM